jgi:hypothetical protein
MPIMTSAVNRTNGPLSGPNVRSSRPGDGGRGGGASPPLLAVEGGGRGGGRAARGDGGRHRPPCMARTPLVPLSTDLFVGRLKIVELKKIKD